MDGFIGSDPTPIDWHEGQDDDYVVRENEVRALGGGSTKRGFRLLERLFRDHS